MRHYKITQGLRDGVNDFLGSEYIRSGDLGREIYHLENYQRLAKVSPKKAKLLMATLFPEEVGDRGFLERHKEKIKKLAKNLHIKVPKPPKPGWANYMMRNEALPSEIENSEDENLFKGNIVRFD